MILAARPLALVLAALATVLLAAPATAPAADGEVVAAWTSEDSALQAESRTLSTALRRAERARFRRGTGPVVAGLQRIERMTIAVRDRVLTQSPSTSNGAAARDAVLRSLAGFTRSVRTLRQAVQAAAKRRLASAHRLLGRSQREAAAAEGSAAAARALFERARIEAQPPPPPPPPPQQPPPDQQQPPPEGGGGGGGGGEPPPPPPPDPCAGTIKPPECLIP